MSGADQAQTQALIAEEIRRVVAESVEDGGCLATSRAAARIARAYPKSGLTAAEIADRILEAAVRARVAVEIAGPPLPARATP